MFANTYGMSVGVSLTAPVLPCQHPTYVRFLAIWACIGVRCSYGNWCLPFYSFCGEKSTQWHGVSAHPFFILFSTYITRDKSRYRNQRWCFSKLFPLCAELRNLPQQSWREFQCIVFFFFIFKNPGCIKRVFIPTATVLNYCNQWAPPFLELIFYQC